MAYLVQHSQQGTQTQSFEVKGCCVIWPLLSWSKRRFEDCTWSFRQSKKEICKPQLAYGEHIFFPAITTIVTVYRGNNSRYMNTIDAYWLVAMPSLLNVFLPASVFVPSSSQSWTAHSHASQQGNKGAPSIATAVQQTPLHQFQNPPNNITLLVCIQAGLP